MKSDLRQATSIDLTTLPAVMVTRGTPTPLKKPLKPSSSNVRFTQSITLAYFFTWSLDLTESSGNPATVLTSELDNAARVIRCLYTLSSSSGDSRAVKVILAVRWWWWLLLLLL